jgi:hypothetical protein
VDPILFRSKSEFAVARMQTVQYLYFGVCPRRCAPNKIGYRQIHQSETDAIYAACSIVRPTGRGLIFGLRLFDLLPESFCTRRQKPWVELKNDALCQRPFFPQALELCGIFINYLFKRHGGQNFLFARPGNFVHSSFI